MNHEEENEDLLISLLETMYITGADYTNTFLALEQIVEEFSRNSQINFASLLNQTATLDELKKAFKPSMSKEFDYVFIL